MIIFAISSGGIISSRAVSMPIIALVTGGGILATKLAEQLMSDINVEMNTTVKSSYLK